MNQMGCKMKDESGITLIEAMVSVAVVAMVIALGIVGVKFLNNIMRENAGAQIQREAQLTLFQITRDIRNAHSVVLVSTEVPNTLILNSINFRLGYDVDKGDIFNPLNIGTITYQFVDNPAGSYLLRRTDFNRLDAGGNVASIDVVERKILRDLLLPDDPATPIIDAIFEPTVAKDLTAPIQITFRLGNGYFRNNPKVYKSQSMIRTGLD
jgi:type II secretory pathway pseudopilin PulG